MKKKMLMTEAEAKDRFCPMGRGKPDIARCTGSDCMAWRWENWSASLTALGKVERWESNRGYCGLGGSVEPGIEGAG
jgi:hypothetical protein